MSEAPPPRDQEKLGPEKHGPEKLGSEKLDSQEGRVPPQRFLKAQLPVRSLVPNMLTMLAVCAGLSAIRMALEERWEMAAAAILIAAILDGLDGRMARLLRSATKFGAELDSLADVINFGVVPALVMYLWALEDAGRLGWIAALVFAICCLLRLARFNTALDDPSPYPFASKYFTGLPAPAAACLALCPLFASFELDLRFIQQPHILSLWMIFVAILMISTLPLFSMKTVRVQRDRVLPALIIGAVVASVVVSYPWETLIILPLGYVATIPLSRRRYYQDLRAWQQSLNSDHFKIL